MSTANAKPIPLGKGPYIEAGVEDVGEARELFLFAVQQHAPIVLESLWRDVLPVCGAAWEARLQSRPDWTSPAFPWPDTVRASVKTWAVNFHLTMHGEPASWISSQAATSLSLRMRYPNLFVGNGQSWGMINGYVTRREAPGPQWTIEFPSFVVDPRDYGNLAEIQAHILAEIRTFPELVRRRLREIQKTSKSLGLRPTPVKRDHQHFEWAVRHQVLSERISEIALAPSRQEVRTVRAGIETVLSLIGLTPYHDPSGRPRKMR